MNSNFALTLGYLNPDLNHSTQGKYRKGEVEEWVDNFIQNRSILSMQTSSKAASLFTEIQARYIKSKTVLLTIGSAFS